MNEESFVRVCPEENGQLPVVSLRQEFLRVLAERVELPLSLRLGAGDGAAEAEGALGTLVVLERLDFIEKAL